jgi:cell division septum initiation protein DivIVA
MEITTKMYTELLLENDQLREENEKLKARIQELECKKNKSGQKLFCDAKVIQEIFSLYSKGTMSFQQVADAVNAMGYRTKLGRAFEKTTVKNILSNASYVELGCVSGEVFESVGQKMRQNRGGI